MLAPPLPLPAVEPPESLLARFVEIWAGRPMQRTAGWYAGRSSTVGGSELAALLGMNPYSRPEDIVVSKAGFSKFTGNTPCRWGTMFEPAIEAFVALDTGSPVYGSDISVPAPGPLRGKHANSPDGYCVAEFYRDGVDCDGVPQWRLATTDSVSAGLAAGRPSVRVPVLLEFKCPYRRIPDGAVPKQYIPQLWSGLAVAPIAQYAMFVDAVFRTCAFSDLGPSPAFNLAYHGGGVGAAPCAWGFTAVYAPRLDGGGLRPAAPDGPAAPDDPDDPDGLDGLDGGHGRPNPAYEAWLMSCTVFGGPPTPPSGAAHYAPEPIDFGECGAATIDSALFHIDTGGFQTTHVGPSTPDGRGAALCSAGEKYAALAAAQAAAPPGAYLLGVIPWKLLKVDYVFVPPRRGFLAEVEPLIVATLAAAAACRAAPDPEAAVAEYVSASRAARAKKKPAVSAATVAKKAKADFAALWPDDDDGGGGGGGGGGDGPQSSATRQ